MAKKKFYIEENQKYSFKKRFFDTLYIWKKEYLRIMKEPTAILIFFVAPTLYPLLYGIIYKNETVRNVPVAVVDMSNSSLSRQFIRMIDATPDVDIKVKCHSLDEARQLFYDHKVHGILLIPTDFSQGINEGKQVFVSGYFDMSSFIYYKSVLTATTLVSQSFGGAIQYKQLVASGLTEQEAMSSIMPVPYDERSLFNPGGGYASFLLPAILILILYQTLMLGICIIAGDDWEENRLVSLVPLNRRYHGTFRIVFGKSLCYFSLYAVIAFYVLGFVIRLFNLPHIGHQGNLLVFMIPFLLSSIFLAMTLSVVMRNLESAFLIILFSTLPLLFLAGISWPQTNIPVFWKAVSYLFPSTHGIQGYVRLNTMEATMNEVSKEYFILWLLTGIYFLTACWVYNHQIKLAAKRMISTDKVSI